MSIETRKLLFIQEFLRIQNEDIIIGLERILNHWKSSNKDTIIPMNIEDFHKEIDLAMEDSYNDNVVKAHDLKQKWS